MRYVERGPEPPELAQYTSMANEDWHPTYGEIAGPDKKAIRAALAREQGYLCGYCGSRIGVLEGDCHIEHVVSQAESLATHQQHLTVAYANMLGSCQGSDTTPPSPQHCGGARGHTRLPVTPFMPDCGEYFSYTSDGRIEATKVPVRENAAEETIRILRLDVKRLNAAREAAIDGALEGLDDLSAEAWRAEAEGYDVPGADGRLTPYCFAIRQVLLRYAAVNREE